MIFMNKFTSYNHKKYTTKYLYRYNFHGNYAELCRLCGYTLGQHGGDDSCLKSNDKPEFYSIKLNNNIKIL